MRTIPYPIGDLTFKQQVEELKGLFKVIQNKPTGKMKQTIELTFLSEYLPHIKFSIKHLGSNSGIKIIEERKKYDLEPIYVTFEYPKENLKYLCKCLFEAGNFYGKEQAEKTLLKNLKQGDIDPEKEP